MNCWNFYGHLGQDAEVRFTQKGTPVVSFSVGVNTGFGENQTTTWANCNLWGRADGTEPGVTPYLVRGQAVCVSGEVTLEEWEARDGTKKTSLKVRVRDITLAGQKGDSKPAPAKAKGRDTNYQEQGRPVNNAEDDFLDDDIPF